MSRELLDFLRGHRLAVLATTARDGAPDAALVHIAVTEHFELVLDTLAGSRKAHNLTDEPRVALVVGGWNDGDARTAQIDGVADRPAGTELERLQAAYFDTFPDGRARLGWNDIVYLRVTPQRIRYSDFSVSPPRLVEHVFACA